MPFDFGLADALVLLISLGLPRQRHGPIITGHASSAAETGAASARGLPLVGRYWPFSNPACGGIIGPDPMSIDRWASPTKSVARLISASPAPVARPAAAN